MPTAFLPSPSADAWRLGPVVLHGYALFLVAGIAVAIWLTDRRYRASGGRAGVIWDMAVVVTPAGLVAGRLYRVLTATADYFGHGSDWVNVLRVWHGGVGAPGAIVGAIAAGAIWCHRRGILLAPVLAAAVPALAVGDAIAVWGTWVSQSRYGAPSGLPWAVDVSPSHRIAGYQSFATFQPLFLYESIFYVVLAVGLAYAIRRRALTGDRAVALLAVFYFTAQAALLAVLAGTPHQQAGHRLGQWAAVAVVLAAMGYLYATRRGRDRGEDSRRARVPDVV